MKKWVLILTASLPFGAYAGVSMEERIKRLEKRIEKLERSQGRQSVDHSSGLKVKDMNHDKMQVGSGRNTAGNPGMPSLTKEQQEEIQKKLELYQKRQIESQKVLDQLMKEP